MEKKTMDNKNKESNVPSWLNQFEVKSNKVKMETNDRAVTYNRCSSKKQDSITWQKKVTAEFVRQNKWELVKSFGEKKSAKTNDRKEFKEMQAFCEKEKVSHIVFYSYDRFSRTGDANILKELREKGIKVHAATQGADDETPSGRMTQKLYLLFAEMENEQRREKIIEGLKNKLRKGEWPGKPTIGYIKEYLTGKKEHDHDKKQCIIGPLGPLIRLTFQWKFHENLTHEAIIQRLIPMGLTLTPCKLSKIFRNPFYCGYITCTLLDAGEIVRGKHEPLISEEIFMAVNGILNSNNHGYKTQNHRDKMPFKASVKCGKCGRPLTAYIRKKIYMYYKCPNNGCCLNMSEKKLSNLFESELMRYNIDSGLLPLVKNQLEASYWMLHKAESTRVKPMKDELTRLKNDLEKMEYNLATGNITPELFEKVSSAHQQKILNIEAELKMLEKDTSNFDKLLDSTLQIACNLLKMWQMSSFENKVRLQKLVFPEGLEYVLENHSLRTISVNPIFIEIASISNNLTTKTGKEQPSETEIFPQLYLRFPSSNFFWENLEKTADVLKGIERELRLMQNPGFSAPVVSMTGSTDSRVFRHISGSTAWYYSGQGDMGQNIRIGGNVSGDTTGLSSSFASR